MNNLEPQITKLMDSITDSVNKLEEIEKVYMESKENRKNEILSYLKELAVYADTQAKRAIIIRQLYWNNQASVLLIKEAFGLGIGKIRKIAGSLTVEYPCNQNCGRTVNKTYTSKSVYNYNLSDKQQRFNWYKCSTCEELEKNESEQTVLEERRYKKERNRELYNMQWEDFIETSEWAKIRNLYIAEVDYKCEICSVEPSTLNIFLHKDNAQSQRNYYSDVNYKYYALCNQCIPRCEDLINREKRDFIKREFFDVIKEWNRENYPHYARY